MVGHIPADDHIIKPPVGQRNLIMQECGSFFASFLPRTTNSDQVVMSLLMAIFDRKSRLLSYILLIFSHFKCIEENDSGRKIINFC